MSEDSWAELVNICRTYINAPHGTKSMAKLVWKVKMADVFKVETILAMADEITRLREENECFLKWTQTLDEHPEHYEGACHCQTCLSYGEIDEVKP